MPTKPKSQYKLPENYVPMEGYAHFNPSEAINTFHACAKKLELLIPAPLPGKDSNVPVPMNAEGTVLLHYPNSEAIKWAKDFKKTLERVQYLIGQIASSTRVVVPVGGAAPEPKPKRKKNGKRKTSRRTSAQPSSWAN